MKENSDNRRERALEYLFDFYMNILEDHDIIRGCPFPDDFVIDTCNNGCGMFPTLVTGNTIFRCPCFTFGKIGSFERLARLLINEGFIPRNAVTYIGFERGV